MDTKACGILPWNESDVKGLALTHTVPAAACIVTVLRADGQATEGIELTLICISHKASLQHAVQVTVFFCKLPQSQLLVKILIPVSVVGKLLRKKL